MHILSRYRLQLGWVLTCLMLVIGMVVIGGLTRLTESGLSIVEWKLVSGIVPPLSDEAWANELAAYRNTPEYQQINKGMNIAEFKQIYWLEYIHRLLGRLVGLAFVVPLLIVGVKKTAEPWLIRRMFWIGTLVALQGTVGWLMVKSGLNDVPWVSPYRLALHLTLALSIFSLLLVSALRLYQQHHGIERMNDAARRPGIILKATLTALLVQIIFGAFVAGLDAGYIYNSFPLMNGDIIPPHVAKLGSLSALVEDRAFLQFIHRWWAFAVLALLALSTMATLKPAAHPIARKLAVLSAAIGIGQVILGIITLLMVVPIGLATLHQAVAFLLFGCLLIQYYCLYWKQDALHLSSINSYSEAQPAIG
jgi:cytochrome c oxidase assembly protein subunit 15